MAKLPGTRELGGLPTADPSRPVGTYDASAVARAGSAMAQAGQSVGEGLMRLGAGLENFNERRRDYDFAKANAEFLTKKIELDNEFAQDRNYGPDDTGKTMPVRYEERLAKIRDEASQSLDAPMREAFTNRSKLAIANGVSSIQSRARQLEGEANIAWVSQQGDTFIDQAINAKDEATRTQVIDAHGKLIDGLVSQNYMSEPQALAAKRAWAQRYATASMLARADTDPEGVINELRYKPGTPQAITARILQVEGTGRNEASTAEGPGQIINPTWLDLIKRHRPELASGRSDDEILKLRADKQLARDMTEANRAENESYLRKRGVEPTAGAQYLAHFLGPAAATAVLKADPNKPVADALVAAVGKEKAAAMIRANPSILDGQLAGSVVAWADGKMGGQGAGSALLSMLPPEQRESILNRAQQQLHKRTANDLSTFKQRVEDTVAEARRTGTVQSPLTESDFVGRLGADAGARAYRDYQAEVQNGADVLSVANMDPAAQQALLTRNAPQPGDGFAGQAKRQDSIAKAIEKVNREKAEDPALFAVTRLPVVAEAWNTFNQVMSDPQATPAARQAAARDFAAKTEMEQARVGIPATDRTIVPKAYVQALADKLSAPQKSGGTINVAAILQKEADLWGENWPKVYRELSKDAEPVVRVIGSGVTPLAAQLLVELKGQSAGEILKDQSEERLSTLRGAVRDVFVPFARSLAGNEGGNKVLNDFEGQALKLTAYWTAAGDSPETAAAKAYSHLIGQKYEFGTSWRVPKASGVSAAQIEDGLATVKRDMSRLDIAPARDTIGGLSADYLHRETLRAIRRDGVWVTAPDESGVALIYNDQAVRRRDGSPVILTWAQLAELAKVKPETGAGGRRVIDQRRRQFDNLSALPAFQAPSDIAGVQ